MEQRLSAAWSAPAAGDVRVGAAGTFEDGVRVNPRYDWQSLPGTVTAAHADAYKRRWAEWREAGGVAEGDGVARDGLDVWGRFAFDVVETKAAAREQWLARGRLSRRVTKPLRLILSGGAGSGKSTAVRAIVRRTRERKVRRLGGASKVSANCVFKKHVKMSCVLAAPTGTASFQFKYGATTAHRAWGVPIGFRGCFEAGESRF